MSNIDTRNKFLVGTGVGDGDIVFMCPLPPRINRADALLLAAYIVSMADPLGEDFAKVLAAVQSA